MGFESAGVRSDGNIGYSYGGKVQSLSSESLSLSSINSLLAKSAVNYDYSAEVQDFNQIAEEAAARAEEDDGGILGWLASAGATVVVGVTSVVSGVAKLGENIVDGAIWVGGTVAAGVARITGADEVAESIENWTMDTIAFDAVGAANEWLYEDTFMSAVNDASYLKYDSDIAQGIQNVTKEVAFYVGATALTIVTGGAAAPVFAVGFAAGGGESAEARFQDTENRDYWVDSLGIGIDATVSGVSAVAAGNSGAKLVKGIKSLAKIGLRGLGRNVIQYGKGIIKSINFKAIIQTLGEKGAKIFGNALLSTLRDDEFILDTAGMVIDDVIYGIKTGDWNFDRMIWETAAIYSSHFVSHYTAGFLPEYEINYRAGLQNQYRVVNEDNLMYGALGWDDAELERWRNNPDSPDFEMASATTEQRLQTGFDTVNKHADDLASRYPDSFDEDMYYEVLLSGRGNRPDPNGQNSYVPPEIRQAWENDFSGGKAYVIQGTGTDGSPFDKFVVGRGSLGAPDGQFVVGESTKIKIDAIMADPSLSYDDRALRISEALGFDGNYFPDGFVMIERDITPDYGIRMSTGNEATANELFTPLTETSGGVIEGIMPSKTGVKVITDASGNRQFSDTSDARILIDCLAH